MGTIRITNLKLRTIIGINDWEREEKQDVIINIAMEVDFHKAIKTDSVADTVDYKAVTKKIIKKIEGSRFNLLEKLTAVILDAVIEDRRVRKATVRVDKPFALRFADSVCVELTKKRTP